MSVSDALLTEREERLRHAVHVRLHHASPQAQQRYVAWLQAVVQRQEQGDPVGENLLAVFAEAALAERPTEVVLTEPSGPVWTAEAEQRLRRMPFFVRAGVQMNATPKRWVSMKSPSGHGPDARPDRVLKPRGKIPYDGLTPLGRRLTPRRTGLWSGVGNRRCATADSCPVARR